MLKIFYIATVSSEQSHTIRTFLCCTDFDTMDTRLHVLEVEEVLAALRHHLQVGQQVQKLGEFVLRFQEGWERDQYQSNCASTERWQRFVKGCVKGYHATCRKSFRLDRHRRPKPWKGIFTRALCFAFNSRWWSREGHFCRWIWEPSGWCVSYSIGPP